jgi:hypothetical protein
MYSGRSASTMPTVLTSTYCVSLVWHLLYIVLMTVLVILIIFRSGRGLVRCYGCQLRVQGRETLLTYR